MKKIMMIMLVLGLVSGTASAQRGHGGGGFVGGGGTRVIVTGGGYYPYGAYYGFGMPLGYGYGYPYGGYGYGYRPSKLDMEVADIKHEYSDKIASARMDQSLTRKEKRYQVRQLKRERDNAVYDAKKNYYKK